MATTMRCDTLQNFYPRSPCGERRSQGYAAASLADFYPRSPCGERQAEMGLMDSCPKFLSTLSLRRATMWVCYTLKGAINFYPRSPCGERLEYTPYYLNRHTISIHALLAESDASCAGGRACSPYFYPRSPCGERLCCRRYLHHHVQISIHALLAESDAPLADGAQAAAAISIHALLAESDQRAKHKPRLIFYFYPRSPCGERPCTCR